MTVAKNRSQGKNRGQRSGVGGQNPEFRVQGSGKKMPKVTVPSPVKWALPFAMRISRGPDSGTLQRRINLHFVPTGRSKDRVQGTEARGQKIV